MANKEQIIGGKYVILENLNNGEGAMSNVYLARDNDLNITWAVKEVKREYSKAALVEAEMIKKLSHPSIVRIVNIIEQNDLIYIVEDFIPGKSLARTLRPKKGKHNNVYPQKEEDVVEWAIMLCNVLNYLHTQPRPIIYRDIKPGNIMLKPDGNIVLIDFGIAREYTGKGISPEECLCTKGYAAPEQYSNDSEPDARSDIYCLGVTMYELVTGKTINENTVFDPIRKVNPNLSIGLEMIINKCISINPNKRYQNCEELRQDLEVYDKLGPAVKKQMKKKVTGFAMLLIVAFMLIVTGVVSLNLEKRAIRSNYDNLLSQGKKAYKADDREYAFETYLEAASTQPERIDVYTQYIDDIIGDDNRITEDETQNLYKLCSKNMPAVKQKSVADYVKLNYEIGFAYFFYYNNESEMVRATKAQAYFEDALNDYDAASGVNKDVLEIYNNICIFYSTIDVKKNKGEKLDYKSLWDNVKALINNNSEGDSNVNVIRLCNLAINIINSYKTQLVQLANIPVSDIEDLFYRIESIVNNLTEKDVRESQEYKEVKEKIEIIKDIGITKTEGGAN